MKRLLLLALALSSLSCAVTVTPWTRTPHECPDGLPPKLILDPGCSGGVCGYSCQPSRWGRSVDTAALPVVPPAPPEGIESALPVLTPPPVVTATPLPIKKIRSAPR